MPAVSIQAHFFYKTLNEGVALYSNFVFKKCPTKDPQSEFMPQ